MGIMDKLKRHLPFYGGILTGDEIERQIRKGNISITPFSRDNINPNSYNIRIGNMLTIYTGNKVFDLKDPDTYKDVGRLPIDEKEGFMLRPGNIYLVPTMEEISSMMFEPVITGRSSIGRLGISIHQEAGFGDIGFSGHLTLQIKVTYPTKIYPYLAMGQVYFLTPYGEIKFLYHGKYHHANEEVPSKWRV